MTNVAFGSRRDEISRATEPILSEMFEAMVQRKSNLTRLFRFQAVGKLDIAAVVDRGDNRQIGIDMLKQMQ